MSLRRNLLRAIAVGAVATVVVSCSDTSPVAPSAASASIAAARTNSADGTKCVSDSKLIGRTRVSGDNGSDSWWMLTKAGFDAAGKTDYKAALEAGFNRPFSTLDEAIAYMIDQLRQFDVNNNGYVCAYELRGAKTSIGDPTYAFYVFLVRDDK